MKTLTIRLDDLDINRIEAIQERIGRQTISGAIRLALKENESYANLLSDLATMFTQEWKVDQKKLKALNHRYGFIQTNLFL